METIKFNIIQMGANYCRITSNDIRQEYRKMADGACISDMETLLAAMKDIKCKVMEKYGNDVVFQYVGNEKVNVMYVIRDKEAGNVIAKFNSYEEAQKELIKYENEDKANGNYTPDFYEIVKEV